LSAIGATLAQIGFAARRCSRWRCPAAAPSRGSPLSRCRCRIRLTRDSPLRSQIRSRTVSGSPQCVRRTVTRSRWSAVDQRPRKKPSGCPGPLRTRLRRPASPPVIRGACPTMRRAGGRLRRVSELTTGAHPDLLPVGPKTRAEKTHEYAVKSSDVMVHLKRSELIYKETRYI
jgi:hypothetical protein